MSVWGKSWLDERGAAQKWFEDQYMFEAVEPLLTALQTTGINLIIEIPTKKLCWRWIVTL
jgi:hypothetical protein